jgi:hypothetical protein
MPSPTASLAKSGRSMTGGRWGSNQREHRGHGELIARSWTSRGHRRRVVDGGELGGRGKSGEGLDTRSPERFFE